MNIEKSLNLVKAAIEEVLEDKVDVTDDLELLGGDLLDSMKLVEVCLNLEDVADDEGFEFDWTSESALSKSRSMFRSVSSLAEEFANQSET